MPGRTGFGEPFQVRRHGERAYLPVTLLWRMLGVSRSGYYAWRKRLPSKRSREDATLTAKIHETIEEAGRDLRLCESPCRVANARDSLWP